MDFSIYSKKVKQYKKFCFSQAQLLRNSMDTQPQEKIIKSAFRTFLKTLFGFLGFFIAIIFFMAGSAIFSPSPLLEEKTTAVILPDASGNRDILPATSPIILEIPIHGIVGSKELCAESINDILLDSRTGLLANNRVKGILLHFNTPGGTVVDADSIFQMIKTYKTRYNIPVYGFVEGLCASGGMYIASSADKMFAGPASLIGSIGVIVGPFFNFTDLMTKVGVGSKTITAGLDKDMLSPFRPWKEGEDASIKAVTDFFYSHFVDVVTTARPQIDKSKLINSYGAQIFDCIKAQNIGYIDEAMSTRDAALLELVKAANIQENEKYQVMSLNPKHPWISDVISSKSPLITGKIEIGFDAIYSKIREQPCYLYTHE